MVGTAVDNKGASDEYADDLPETTPMVSGSVAAGCSGVRKNCRFAQDRFQGGTGLLQASHSLFHWLSLPP